VRYAPAQCFPPRDLIWRAACGIRSSGRMKRVAWNISDVWQIAEIVGEAMSHVQRECRMDEADAAPSSHLN